MRISIENWPIEEWWYSADHSDQCSLPSGGACWRTHSYRWAWHQRHWPSGLAVSFGHHSTGAYPLSWHCEIKSWPSRWTRRQTNLGGRLMPFVYIASLLFWFSYFNELKRRLLLDLGWPRVLELCSLALPCNLKMTMMTLSLSELRGFGRHRHWRSVNWQTLLDPYLRNLMLQVLSKHPRNEKWTWWVTCLSQIMAHVLS